MSNWYICSRCKTQMVCPAGCSAHPDNWYCPECCEADQAFEKWWDKLPAQTTAAYSKVSVEFGFISAYKRGKKKS